MIFSCSKYYFFLFKYLGIKCNAGKITKLNNQISNSVTAIMINQMVVKMMTAKVMLLTLKVPAKIHLKCRLLVFFSTVYFANIV